MNDPDAALRRLLDDGLRDLRASNADMAALLVKLADSQLNLTQQQVDLERCIEDMEHRLEESLTNLRDELERLLHSGGPGRLAQVAAAAEPRLDSAVAGNAKVMEVALTAAQQLMAEHYERQQAAHAETPRGG
jgi:hypothetical protein